MREVEEHEAIGAHQSKADLIGVNIQFDLLGALAAHLLFVEINEHRPGHHLVELLVEHPHALDITPRKQEAKGFVERRLPVVAFLGVKVEHGEVLLGIADQQRTPQQEKIVSRRYPIIIAPTVGPNGVVKSRSDVSQNLVVMGMTAAIVRGDGKLAPNLFHCRPGRNSGWYGSFTSR